MTPLPPTARVCASTGLVLVPSDGSHVWRVAKVAYGPLGPLLRPADPDVDPASWGRFDTRGGRTVYVAGTRECAYAEVLAYLRRSLGQADSLAKDAAFLGLTHIELAAIIEEEWTAHGHMRPGHLPGGWRVERALYDLVLPSTGWWVLLEHPTSIAAAEAALADSLASVGIGQLDVSVLRGPNRDATVLLADWIRAATLDDGSPAHGIRYDSRHATGVSWAYWLRRVDDGHEAGSEPMQVADSEPIEPTDTDMTDVATRFAIKVW